jgi:acetyl-CoA C-acetyltransferase
MGVQAGHQDLVIAGGVESMSRWPAPEGAPDFTSGNAALRELFPMVPQGISADLIATIGGFTREDVDAFALVSQQRAAIAQAEGRFDRSVVPILNPDGTIALAKDEHLRPDTTMESLAGLSASFARLGAHQFKEFDRTFDEMCKQVYPEINGVDHVHHAGNSSGVVDGSGALLLASSGYAKKRGLKPRARVVAMANMGDSPTLMLNAPVPAARKVLAKAGLTLDDIDLFEINEAFAVVAEKFIRDLRLDRNKVNVNGGAIALGHPIGATGSILIGSMLDELERRDLKRGLITMCAAGGMAPAIIIERV